MKMGFDDPEPEHTTQPLNIELVPGSSWGNNLRSALKRSEWDKLRKAQYALAGNRCEVCGGKGRRHPVECHEVWSYNEGTNVQTLESLVALCPACHECKHIGLAGIRGRTEQALRHLAKVNGWTSSRARLHANEAFDVWERRSRSPWTLDLSWLEEHGVAIPAKPKGG
jgi:hypothetical protein